MECVPLSLSLSLFIQVHVLVKSSVGSQSVVGVNFPSLSLALPSFLMFMLTL